jgi:hypothetical protein
MNQRRYKQNYQLKQIQQDIVVVVVVVVVVVAVVVAVAAVVVVVVVVVVAVAVVVVVVVVAVVVVVVLVVVVVVVVVVEPGWTTRRGASPSPGRVKNVPFSISSRPALRSTQPPIKWVPEALSRG